MVNTKRKTSEKVSSSKKAKVEPQENRANETNKCKHWLMKSEPESRYENNIDVKFGIEDLKKEPNQTACWDGVRNYQARNFMMQMKNGEQAFFYHSNCKPPGKHLNPGCLTGWGG